MRHVEDSFEKCKKKSFIIRTDKAISYEFCIILKTYTYILISLWENHEGIKIQQSKYELVDKKYKSNFFGVVGNREQNMVLGFLCLYS